MEISTPFIKRSPTAKFYLNLLFIESHSTRGQLMTFLNTRSSEALQQPFCISIQTLSHAVLALGKNGGGKR